MGKKKNKKDKKDADEEMVDIQQINLEEKNFEFQVNYFPVDLASDTEESKQVFATFEACLTR